MLITIFLRRLALLYIPPLPKFKIPLQLSRLYQKSMEVDRGIVID